MTELRKAFPYSDNVASIHHDGVETLTVQFKHKRGPGPVWAYTGVPRDVAEVVASATSPGSTLRLLVVSKSLGANPKYRGVKVSG